ncbi:MAG: DUF2510 domain-containing protein [Actinomycetota bacterium]|nr:DUF2510 domain-containing protein [Actinomycetota bacterium]
MKAKTRAKLEKSRADQTGTFQDPIRLYDRPIWFDVWFIVGLMLTIPDILVAILITVRAEFDFDIAGRAISGYAFLLVLTILKFGLGSLMPVFIRRSMRRGKLKVEPLKLEPGFYQDPIRKGSQRFWDGTAWTDELRAPYKREPGRMLFLCGVGFLLSLLIGLGFSVKTFNAVKVQHSYEAGSSLVQQFSGTSLKAQTPGSVVDSSPAFAEVSGNLTAALAAFPRKEGEATEIEGIDLILYESYASGFASLAEQITALASKIQACPSADSPCASSVLEAASPALAESVQQLPVVQTRDQAASQ